MTGGQRHPADHARHVRGDHLLVADPVLHAADRAVREDPRGGGDRRLGDGPLGGEDAERAVRDLGGVGTGVHAPGQLDLPVSRRPSALIAATCSADGRTPTPRAPGAARDGRRTGRRSRRTDDAYPRSAHAPRPRSPRTSAPGPAIPRPATTRPPSRTGTPPATVSTRYGSTDVIAGSISALGRWKLAAPAATASATNGAAVGAPSIVSCWIGSPRESTIATAIRLAAPAPRRSPDRQARAPIRARAGSPAAGRCSRAPARRAARRTRQASASRRLRAAPDTADPVPTARSGPRSWRACRRRSACSGRSRGCRRTGRSSPPRR